MSSANSTQETQYYDISDVTTFLFFIRRSSAREELGLHLEAIADSSCFRVDQISPTGLAQMKNVKLAAIPELSSKIIATNDYITAVNGFDSDVELMKKHIKEDKELFLRISTQRPLCNTSIDCEEQHLEQAMPIEAMNVPTKTSIDCEEQRLEQAMPTETMNVPTTTLPPTETQQMLDERLRQSLRNGGYFHVEEDYIGGGGYLPLNYGDTVEVIPRTLQAGEDYNEYPEYVYGFVWDRKGVMGWIPTSILTDINMQH